MKKLEKLQEKICSFENLLGAYREAAKGKRYREEVISYTWKLEENLLELQKELENRTYRVGPYRKFFVRYPKPRAVIAIGFRDRIVQHAIYRQIEPYLDKRYEMHSYGCRKGKGNLRAAKQLLEMMRLYSRKPDGAEYVIIKDDISKYFYRVDHEITMERYQGITEDDWFLWLMGEIIHNRETPFGLPRWMDVDIPEEKWLFDKGMPIGNLTSQETANLYLDKLDKFVKRELRIRAYVRYMDDFVMIVKRGEAEKIQGEVLRCLQRELKLDMSQKSRVLPLKRGCEFVGYRVTPEGLRLRKKTTKHMKATLRHLDNEVAGGRMEPEKARSSAESYLGMLDNCSGEYMRTWVRENIRFMEAAA